MAQMATFVISIRDAKRRRGKVVFHINLESGTWGQYNSALEDAIEYLQEVARRINQVIKGCIVRLTLNIDLALPAGIRAVPEPDSDVEEGGKFTFDPPGVAYFQNVIPTFNHELFPPGISILHHFYGDDDLESLVMLLVQSTDAPDWAAEYGVVTDNRGVSLHLAFPPIQKVFKES